MYVTAQNGDSVAWFSRSSATGALTYGDRYISATNIEEPWYVVVSQDGLNAYVSGRSSDSIAWFSRDLTTGALTYMDAYTDLNIDGAYGVALSVDDEQVYVAAGDAHAVA
mgnify:FL=1